MKLVFATNNAHKLEEIQEMLGSQHEIVSLKDIQCHEDIPEGGAEGRKPTASAENPLDERKATGGPGEAAA